MLNRSNQNQDLFLTVQCLSLVKFHLPIKILDKMSHSYANKFPFLYKVFGLGKALPRKSYKPRFPVQVAFQIKLKHYVSNTFKSFEETPITDFFEFLILLLALFVNGLLLFQLESFSQTHLHHYCSQKLKPTASINFIPYVAWL